MAKKNKCEITKPEYDGARGYGSSLWCSGYRIVAKGDDVIGFGGVHKTRAAAERALKSAKRDPRHVWTVKAVRKGWVERVHAPTALGARRKAERAAKTWCK